MSSSVTVASGLSLDGWTLGKYKIVVSLEETIQDATQQLYLLIGTGLSSGTGPAVLLDYTYSITYIYNGQSTTKSGTVSKNGFISSGTVNPGLTINITKDNRAITQKVTITALTLTLRSDLYGPNTYTMPSSQTLELDRNPTTSLILRYYKPTYHDTPETVLQEVSVTPTEPVTITGTVFSAHGYNCSAPWKTSNGTVYNAGNSIYINSYTKLSGTISNKSYTIAYHEPISSEIHTVQVNSYDTYVTMPDILGTTDPSYKYLGWSTKENPTLANLEYVIGASVARVGLLSKKYPDSSNNYTVHLYPVFIPKATTITYDQGFTSKYIDQSRTDNVLIGNTPSIGYDPLRESAYSFNSLKSVKDQRLVAPSGSGSTVLVLKGNQDIRSYYRKNTNGTVYCGIVTFNGGTQENPSYYTGLLLVSTSSSSKYYFDGTSYIEDIDHTYDYEARFVYNKTTYYATTSAALAGVHTSITEQSEFDRVYVGDYSDQVYSTEVLTQMSTDLLNLYYTGISVDINSTYKTLGPSTIKATWDIKDGYDYVRVNGTWKPTVIFRKVNNHWTRCLVNNKDNNGWGIRPYWFVVDIHNSDEDSKYSHLRNSENYTAKYSSTLDRDITSITINGNNYSTSKFKQLPRMTGDTSVIYNVVPVDQPTINFTEENAQEIYVDSSRGINVPIRSKVPSQAQDGMGDSSTLTAVYNTISDQEDNLYHSSSLYIDHITDTELTSSIYLRFNNLSNLLYSKKTADGHIFKGFVYVLSGCTSSLYKSTIMLQMSGKPVTEVNVTIIYKDTSGDIKSKELNTTNVSLGRFSAEIDDTDNPNFKEDMDNLIRNYPISSLNSDDDRYFAILVEATIE